MASVNNASGGAHQNGLISNWSIPEAKAVAKNGTNTIAQVPLCGRMEMSLRSALMGREERSNSYSDAETSNNTDTAQSLLSFSMTLRLSDTDFIINQRSYEQSQRPLCGAFLRDLFWPSATGNPSEAAGKKAKIESSLLGNQRERHFLAVCC